MEKAKLLVKNELKENNLIYSSLTSLNHKMRTEALKLYKDLLRYSEKLKYTDKKYFVHRVRKDFLQNRPLQNSEQIDFHIKVRRKSFHPPQKDEFNSKYRINT